MLNDEVCRAMTDKQIHKQTHKHTYRVKTEETFLCLLHFFIFYFRLKRRFPMQYNEIHTPPYCGYRLQGEHRGVGESMSGVQTHCVWYSSICWSINKSIANTIKAGTHGTCLLMLPVSRSIPGLWRNRVIFCSVFRRMRSLWELGTYVDSTLFFFGPILDDRYKSWNPVVTLSVCVCDNKL